jgi:hypothetical protein
MSTTQEYNICCYCDDYCDVESQCCHRCARETTMASLGYDKFICDKMEKMFINSLDRTSTPNCDQLIYYDGIGSSPDKYYMNENEFRHIIFINRNSFYPQMYMNPYSYILKDLVKLVGAKLLFK